MKLRAERPRPWRGPIVLGSVALALAALAVAGRASGAGVRAPRAVSEARADEEREHLVVNGVSVEVAARVEPGDAGEVIDALARACAGRATRLAGPEQGYVACHEGDETRVSYVRGAGPRSLVVAASGRTAELAGALRERGDVPGTDLPGVPRPLGATRTVSVALEGAAHRMVTYESPEPTAAIVRALRAELASRGWSAVAAAPSPASVLRLRRGSRRVDVVVSDGDRGARTITYFEVEAGRAR